MSLSAENVVRLKQIVAVLAVVLGIAIALMPPPNGLNRQAMIALGIVVWAVFWWIDIESLAAFAKLKNFQQVIYRNEQDFNNIVSRLSTLKDVAVVGFGGCVIEKAAQCGLPYYLIRSSKNSVHQAVLSARNIVDQHIKERTRSRRLNNIINYSLSGIISVNRDKTVATCNRPAKQMLDLHGKKLVGMDIGAAACPPELKQMLGNGEYTVDKVLPLKGKPWW